MTEVTNNPSENPPPSTATPTKKRYYCTRLFWEEIKALPNFDELMVKKGLKEEDIEII
jgi:hypothetical protein